MKKPPKVVWLCHFSNEEFAKLLGLNDIKEIEFAPWIPNTLKLFELDNRISITVVAPVKGIKGLYKKLVVRGIDYYFYNADVPFIHRKFHGIPLYFKRIFPDSNVYNNLIVRYLVSRIKPDLIHLHGAENPYYSQSIMQFVTRIPTLLTVQGFAFQSLHNKSKRLAHRINIERMIIGSMKHVAIRTDAMLEAVLSINARAICHWHRYAMNEINPIETDKKYDIVFFARVCADKGIEDLLKATQLVIKSIPDCKLAVIGSSDNDYMHYLKGLSHTLSIESNVVWLGYQAKQCDVHLLVSQAKVTVLPTYNDIISGTIIESMKLGIPVVAYKTGSIPELNVGEERILINDQGDIAGLANSILKVLCDSHLAKTMSDRSLTYANNRFGNNNIRQDILKIYNEILNYNEIEAI